MKAAVLCPAECTKTPQVSSQTMKKAAEKSRILAAAITKTLPRNPVQTFCLVPQDPCTNSHLYTPLKFFSLNTNHLKTELVPQVPGLAITETDFKLKRQWLPW